MSESEKKITRTERRKEKMMRRFNAILQQANARDKGIEVDKSIVEDKLEGPEVDFFFCDDSKQCSPSRPGMGPMVAIGGINVPAEEVGTLRKSLNELCRNIGFPSNQEFKWSPGRDLWMRSNLKGEKRNKFYLDVISLLSTSDVIATIVIEDKNYQTATHSDTAEEDVTILFLERAESQCHQGSSEGFIIVDRPSGSRSSEDKFLFNCLETIQKGTDYIQPKHIAHNILSTPSKFSRLLQAADLITGCTLSYISGDKGFSPDIFAKIIPLLYNSMGRIGGYGLKIHPDYKYGNLYYWLLNDTHFYKKSIGYPMPRLGLPYSSDPFKY